MGGTKKKSLAQAQKAQDLTAKKKEKETNTIKKLKRDIMMPKLDENEAIKIFKPLKAITIYNTSNTLNIKASVASALLKNLESKGFLTKIGGYSGNYIYTLSKEKKP